MFAPVRPRQGLRYPDPHRLRARAEAAARLRRHRADLTIIAVHARRDARYARELAPLAGVYPALKLGPAWWFHDSPEGMRRFRELTTETAGFYNTVGFNDDTRAFPSIPARHDVARRVDCAFLARLVAEASPARRTRPTELAPRTRLQRSRRRRTGSDGRLATQEKKGMQMHLRNLAAPPSPAPCSPAQPSPRDRAALLRHPPRRLSDRGGGASIWAS